MTELVEQGDRLAQLVAGVPAASARRIGGGRGRVGSLHARTRADHVRRGLGVPRGASGRRRGVVGAAEVARPVGLVGLDPSAHRREPGDTHRVALQQRRGGLDGGARGIEVALAAQQLAEERAVRAVVLRLAGAHRDAPGLFQQRPRGLVIAAQQRELAAAQVEVREVHPVRGPVAITRHERLGLVEAPEVEQDLGGLQAQPALGTVGALDALSALQRDREALLAAAGEVQRLREVVVARAELLLHRGLGGDLDRLAQHCGALVLLADRHERDAERVE